ncbi:MAG: uncharacterized protein A8A55_0395 [Amphiamblys sp. WSBS2006]|nr:MAG: uncharacterized protein A8A55_0395 [Amphiamblys sp. WSBS2006]
MDISLRSLCIKKTPVDLFCFHNKEQDLSLLRFVYEEAERDFRWKNKRIVEAVKERTCMFTSDIVNSWPRTQTTCAASREKQTASPLSKQKTFFVSFKRTEIQPVPDNISMDTAHKKAALDVHLCFYKAKNLSGNIFDTSWQPILSTAKTNIESRLFRPKEKSANFSCLFSQKKKYRST